LPHLQRVTGCAPSVGIVVVLPVPEVSEPGVLLLEVLVDEEVDASGMLWRIGFVPKFASTSTAVPAGRLDGRA
jgi:hypothetical protein